MLNNLLSRFKRKGRGPGGGAFGGSVEDLSSRKDQRLQQLAGDVGKHNPSQGSPPRQRTLRRSSSFTVIRKSGDGFVLETGTSGHMGGGEEQDGVRAVRVSRSFDAADRFPLPPPPPSARKKWAKRLSTLLQGPPAKFAPVSTTSTSTHCATADVPHRRNALSWDGNARYTTFDSDPSTQTRPLRASSVDFYSGGSIRDPLPAGPPTRYSNSHSQPYATQELPPFRRRTVHFHDNPNANLNSPSGSSTLTHQQHHTPTPLPPPIRPYPTSAYEAYLQRRALRFPTGDPSGPFDATTHHAPIPLSTLEEGSSVVSGYTSSTVGSSVAMSDTSVVALPDLSDEEGEEEEEDDDDKSTVRGDDELIPSFDDMYRDMVSDMEIDDIIRKWAS
ncbi:hypothetical protein HKX48_009445 [Thoreauomyces humboldtii]|nr:hypothetical protein HKX48_009445 [Thoreauomyces humboldtii]